MALAVEENLKYPIPVNIVESTPKCKLKNGSASNFKTTKGKELVCFSYGLSGHMSHERPKNFHVGIKEMGEVQERDDVLCTLQK